MALEIEYLKKEDLKPYANNAKLHPAEQVEQIEQIKNSIREFGFNDPIAVWGDNEIVEGHGRLLAAMEIDELEKVPVIRLDDLSDEQRRAYMLVHNKLTMNTGFDLDLIEMELAKISEIPMDYYGFKSVEDIQEQLEDFFIPQEEETEAPKNEKSTEKEFVFIITPKEENRKELLSFLSREGVEYSAK